MGGGERMVTVNGGEDFVQFFGLRYVLLHFKCL